MSSSRTSLRCFDPLRSVRVRWVSAGLASGLLLGPAKAAAQPAAPAAYSAPPQVQLKYGAGAGCPSQTAFVNEIGARIRRPIEWVATNPNILIVVTLGQADDHATGKLEVTQRAMEPTRREFIANTCAEVGSALALVTALTLDPNARTEALAAEPTGSDASAAAADPPTPATVLPPPASAPPPTAPSPSTPVLKPPPEPAPPPTRDFEGWVGPAVGASLGYAPTPLVTVGLSLGARLRVSRALSPSLQLTPAWGKTGSTGPAAAGGSFAWTMARLEACPTQFRLAGLALAACAAAELGRLSARGSASQVVPVTAERWWFAAGVAASLHFAVGHWYTRLGAQALFPATRDEFVFRDPDQHVHEASALVYGTSLGFGFQFGS